jgi:hypothetical protein
LASLVTFVYLESEGVPTVVAHLAEALVDMVADMPLDAVTGRLTFPNLMSFQNKQLQLDLSPASELKTQHKALALRLLVCTSTIFKARGMARNELILSSSMIAAWRKMLVCSIIGLNFDACSFFHQH